MENMNRQFNVPMNLTWAQRKAIEKTIPPLGDRLKIDEQKSRTILFSLNEVREIAQQCERATSLTKGMERNSLLHIADAAAKAVEWYKEGGIGEIPITERVYQFKITLNGSKPEIWRRIQTKDCNLDKLHEHIQTAMGWTNSHLHEFIIVGIRHGDPQLLCEGWEDEEPPVDSRYLRISRIFTSNSDQVKFDYNYDFGDSWEHTIQFEGCIRAETGARYPLCTAGERACPPEDIGGLPGYKDFLTAISKPKHKEHKMYLDWSGPFDPDAFDIQSATKRMRKGLPDWRLH